MPDIMALMVFTPAMRVVECDVLRVEAVGRSGSFGLRPRHLDIAAPLVPGILSFVDAEGRERFVAVDGGVLLKVGRSLRVATRRAVEGGELSALRVTVERQFLSLTDHEKAARQAAARLEAGIIRRFIELEKARP